jgi:prolyl-tRNA editing enzyme YbaK/EbsC (Cys-tRNA(Pro) deacylase)
MSLESVRQYFADKSLDIPIIETTASTATVALAAAVHGVEPGQIAKTLAVRVERERVVLIVARGDVRIDNRKLKEALGRCKMLATEEVEALTGHPVGGVCPFGLATPLPVFLDVSLQAYTEVLPAAGSTHSAVKISTLLLAQLFNEQWLDVCQAPDPAATPGSAVLNEAFAQNAPH